MKIDSFIRNSRHTQDEPNKRSRINSGGYKVIQRMTAFELIWPLYIFSRCVWGWYCYSILLASAGHATRCTHLTQTQLFNLQTSDLCKLTTTLKLKSLEAPNEDQLLDFKGTKIKAGVIANLGNLVSTQITICLQVQAMILLGNCSQLP